MLPILLPLALMRLVVRGRVGAVVAVPAATVGRYDVGQLDAGHVGRRRRRLLSAPVIILPRILKIGVKSLQRDLW